jgi:hypothetical protein
MPDVLGVLPVRSAARLACPTAAKTTNPRVIFRARRDQLLMAAKVVGKAVKNLLHSLPDL